MDKFAVAVIYEGGVCMAVCGAQDETSAKLGCALDMTRQGLKVENVHSVSLGDLGVQMLGSPGPKSKKFVVQCETQIGEQDKMNLLCFVHALDDDGVRGIITERWQCKILKYRSMEAL